MKLTQDQKFLETVITEAWNNPTYKAELIANPVEAIKSLTGMEVNIPEGKRLVVVDQTDTSVLNVNIPPQPNMDDVELTEEQLEVVAGGGTLLPPLATIFLPPIICFPPNGGGTTGPYNPIPDGTGVEF